LSEGATEKTSLSQLGERISCPTACPTTRPRATAFDHRDLSVHEGILRRRRRPHPHPPAAPDLEPTPERLRRLRQHVMPPGRRIAPFPSHTDVREPRPGAAQPRAPETAITDKPPSSDSHEVR